MHNSEYRITRFSSVEGNDLAGWVVWDEVTGMAQEINGQRVRYKPYEAAETAALLIAEYYKTTERCR